MDHLAQAVDYSIEDLEHALEDGNEEKALEIYQAGMKSGSSKWQNGYIPLCLAYKYYRYQIADKFLQFDLIQVNNNKQEKEDIPLHLAVRCRTNHGIRKLLEKGADMNTENLLRQNVFDLALQKKDWTALDILIDHTNDDNINESTFYKLLFDLIIREECYYSDYVERLLTRCKSFDLNNSKVKVNFLSLAVEKKKTQVIKSLLNHGFDINYFNKFDGRIQTALDKACEIGDLDVVKLLLDNGASTDIFKYSGGMARSAIHTATRNNHLDIVKELVDRGENIDKPLPNFYHVVTPLMIACDLDSLETAKFLIDHGANVNFKNDRSFTPIQDALRPDLDSKPREVFSYILRLKNFRLIIDDVKYIGMVSVRFGMLNEFDSLFKHIGKLNSKDRLRYELDINLLNNSTLKRSIIHHAVRYNLSGSCIKLLIENGVNINLRNYKGRTALHVACRYRRHYHTVVSLIQYGADINLRCAEGHSPIIHMTDDKIRESCYDTDEDEDEDEDDDEQWDHDEEIADYYSDYVMKLKYLGMFVNDDNYNFAITKLKNSFEDIEKYAKEIETMKQEKICSAMPDNFTYYKFITGSLIRRTYFINHEEIYKVLSIRNKYRPKFPEFTDVISYLFHEALVRKILLDKCDPIFVMLLCQEDSFLFLPYLCVEKIISYFKNDDLRLLFNTFNFE